MRPPSHLYIQIGAPHTVPQHADTNMEIRVAVQYSHPEHTLYPFPTHFPRSSYTTSCVSAKEDSKMDTKNPHPQRTPGERGPLCLSSGVGPQRETWTSKSQGNEGHWSLALGWVGASWKRGPASGQRQRLEGKKQRMGWG